MVKCVNKLLSLKSFILFFLALPLMGGCLFLDREVADPQFDLDPLVQKVVNPSVVAHNPRLNPLIKVAIIDSGVDYNHPAIAPWIVFSRDSLGNIKGAGYDFVGQDPWPSPYLGRPLDNINQLELIHRIIKVEPLAEVFLNPKRNIGDEYRINIGHGTHVAGLVLKQNPNGDVGILPYRVTPANRSSDIEEAASLLTNTLQAIRLAAQDGAQIINISAMLTIPKLRDKSNQKIHRILDQMAQLIRQNSQILFVVALGDLSTQERSAPCGIDAPNLICVGMWEQKDKYALGPQVSQVVFAPGKNIHSTMPWDLCTPPQSELISIGHELDDGAGEDPRYFNTTVKQMIAKCLDTRGYGVMTGSSQATPFISGLAARKWAQEPEISIDKLVKYILSHNGL